MKKDITYKDSGVDIDKAEESLKLIKPLVQPTLNSSVLASVGSFGALYDLGEVCSKYKHPVLVQSIDSVGTKLMIANMAEKHSTIGIDMVAHSCNDILCQGAEPLTFLDYIAVEKLKAEHIEEIVKGITYACNEVGLPLVGGETAELPGVYKIGEYDLVGSVTGVVEKDLIINGEKIRQGDIIVGLESNGLHTNGYSLARKVFFDVNNYKIDNYFEEIDNTLGDELLKPHKNYTSAILQLLKKYQINGIAHITGGGLQGNLSRIIPSGCEIEIDYNSWDVPPVFKLIQREGNIPGNDMYKTFNMGIGLVLVIKEENSEPIVDNLKDHGIGSFKIGKIK